MRGADELNEPLLRGTYLPSFSVVEAEKVQDQEDRMVEGIAHPLGRSRVQKGALQSSGATAFCRIGRST